MNDLTELREGWGQPEPPSGAAYSAARAALLQQAAAARAATPEQARLTVLCETERPARPGRSRRRRTGWLAAGVGLTAAAAVGVAAVIVSPSGVGPVASGGGRRASGGRPVAISRLSARQILLEAATTAAAAPARTGAYWFVKTAGPASPGAPGTMPVSETWSSRSGLEYDRSPTDSRNVFLSSRGFDVGGSFLTYAQIKRLPTDPASLKAWITHSMRHPQTPPTVQEPGPPAPRAVPGRVPARYFESGLAYSLSGLLADVPAPPALRAAAFRALASMPDVRKLGYADGGVVLAIYGPKAPAAKWAPGKEPKGTGVLKLIIDPVSFTLRGEINYQGTTKYLAARWTNQLPKVVPVNR